MLCAEECVQRLGCPVGTVRPFDGLGTERDARELAWGAKGLEDRPRESVAKIHLAREAVAEFEPEHVIANVPHPGDANSIEQGS